MQSDSRVHQIISNIITVLFVLIIAVLLFVIGHDTNDYRYALCGTFLLWTYGMIYGLMDLSNLYGYTIMNFMLFVFFLSRPTLAQFYDVDWTVWNDGIVEKALLLVLVSEAGMLFGSLFTKPAARVNSLYIKKTVNYNESVQTALLVIVLTTAVLNAYSTLKNYAFYANLSYESLYISGGTADNALIRASTTICPYAVFAYLATMPSKKKSMAVLGIYIMLGLPMFLLGNRASLVLRIAFAVSYFFIRDYTKGSENERWIKKSIKIGFIVFVVASVAFLGAFNYYRAGQDPNSETPIPIMMDFFYRQGTTFDTICQGLQYQTRIMNLPHKVPYSIGPVYDTIAHSTLSNMLFNTSSLGSGNSINMVVNGNSLSHKLSYIVLGDISYLSGHGRGSSYLIELYYDGGLTLIAVFSIALGVYLSSLNKIIQQGRWFVNTVVIASLSRVFYIPRASTFDFLSFLFTPHFWLIIILVVMTLFFSDLKEACSRTCRLTDNHLLKKNSL